MPSTNKGFCIAGGIDFQKINIFILGIVCYYAIQTLSLHCIIITSKNLIMKFVDRVEESERLSKALAGNNPSFVVVYGRRRLGKSTLLKRVLSENDIYYHY